LQTLDAMEKKVLGICFGHQVLDLVFDHVIWTISLKLTPN
jgi:anthranilate/para-aminobenzoate synthase component II